MSYKINSLIEALTYLNYRVNGHSVSEYAKESIQKNPNEISKINFATKPVLELESELNRIPLDLEKAKIYFLSFSGITDQPPTGMNAAMLFFNENLFNDYVSFEETVKECRERNDEAKLAAFSVGLLESCQLLPGGEFHFKNFYDMLTKKSLQANDKMKVIDMLVHYDEHLENLIDIIRPFIDAIQAASELYAPIIAEYEKIHSNKEDIKAYFKERMKTNFSADGEFKLTPYLFGFDKYISMFTNSTAEDVFNVQLYAGLCYNGNNKNKSSKTATQSVANLAKAISDPTRLELLHTIKNKAAYGQELAEKMDLFPTTVSHHMSKLLEAGFIESRPELGKNYFILNKAGIKEFIHDVTVLLLDEDD